MRDNINQSETLSIDNAETESLENLPETSISLSQPSFIPLSNDPVFWPATISDAQRCDIIKRGPEQVNITFPYNSAKRQFSTVHYERTMINGETIHRSWLLYSVITHSNRIKLSVFAASFLVTRLVPFVLI